MESLLHATLRMWLFWSLFCEFAQGQRYHVIRVPKLLYSLIW